MNYKNEILGDASR